MMFLSFKIGFRKFNFETQEIVDATADTFASETLNVSKGKWSGWHDKNDFNELKNKLLTMREHLDKYYPMGGVEMKDKAEKPSKIFISHASKDKEYVAKIIELLDDMGLTSNEVFCSSFPGYDIPVGEDIFDYLREQFDEYRLYILFVHSKNYYKSPVCLNEMGAAWVLKNACTSLLLPGFGFSDMTGAVDSKSIAIKLDNDETEVKDKLNQLYEKMVSEFGLSKKADIIWEQKRNRFIKEINDLYVPEDEENEQQEDDIELLENGALVKKSEVNQGKKLYYCSACYQNYNKLFPIVKGTMPRNKFCTNCKMAYGL